MRLIALVLLVIMRLISWNERNTSFTILYAFISILCRLSLVFVTLALPFFEPCYAISPLWTSICFILSVVDQNQEWMLLLLFLPKENLSEQTCLAEQLLPLTTPSYVPILVMQCKLLFTLGWNWSLLFACCLAISVMD